MPPHRWTVEQETKRYVTLLPSFKIVFVAFLQHLARWTAKQLRFICRLCRNVSVAALPPPHPTLPPTQQIESEVTPEAQFHACPLEMEVVKNKEM